MKKNHANKCLTCKWVTFGRYSKYYGGCPIGCNRPMSNGKRNYQESCYEEKEEKENARKK